MDWQRELGLDDVKMRLARSIARSGSVRVCRLFTGHRGVGKSTELKRVKRILEEGRVERKLFVSLLEAERWMDLNDVAAGDIVLHITRQLVDDLKAKGFDCAMTSLEQFFQEVRDILRQDVILKTVKAPSSLAEFGAVLKDVPIARSTLRGLFQGHLPTIYQLINDVILKQAREWLHQPTHGGFDDILIIVDELDRVPQRVLRERELTNYENLFLDNAGILKALDCDLLYTIPMPLAYSGCRDQVFAESGLLDRMCRLSGGHVRNLFILLRSAMERCDRLPLTAEVVERTVRRQAIDISLAIKRKDWTGLRKVHSSHEPAEDEPEVWNGLLRNLLVFPYEDAEGPWYDWNPLVGEVPGGES